MVLLNLVRALIFALTTLFVLMVTNGAIFWGLAVIVGLVTFFGETIFDLVEPQVVRLFNRD